MDFLEQLGPLALWSRLRRLSEKLTPGVVQIYAEQEVRFEPRWFTVSYYLWKNGSARQADIVRALKLSHPSVVQTVNQMEKEGIVERRSSPSDQRVTIVVLTPKGEDSARKLEPAWEDIGQAARSLLEETCPGFLNSVKQMETALEEVDIYRRIKRAFVQKNGSSPTLVEFRDEHLKEFRRMNEEWLQETVGISDFDRQVLADPGRHILDKGGRIYMAHIKGTVVGSFAILPLDRKQVELVKFSIKKEFRGLGLGKAMAGLSILKAKEKGYETILLLTHEMLKEATSLYRKAGFTVIPSHPLLTDFSGRCSIIMELKFNP